MGNPNQDRRSQPRSHAKAITLGFVAATLTAGAVSLSTPDGNLVVTLVPALVVGLVVFGVAAWHTHR